MSAPLASAVVSGLKRQILDGSIPLGAKLPSESELIAAYAVSRTVVREAVTRLRAEGLVETFKGRGSFVLALPPPTPFAVNSGAIRSHRDVLAVIDLRLGIETEAAALAATRHTASDARAIDSALAAFDSATPEEAIEADFAVHRAITAATGNQFYLDLLDSLGPAMIMLPRTQLRDDFSITDAAHVERVTREHAHIADAILAREPDAARAAMRVHLSNSRRRLQSR